MLAWELNSSDGEVTLTGVAERLIPDQGEGVFFTELTLIDQLQYLYHDEIASDNCKSFQNTCSEGRRITL